MKYIWQLPDWPNFKWDAEALLEPLGQLSLLHGQLHGIMAALGFDCANRTSLAALTDELINSSDIEGITLNADSVRSSIARRLGIEQDGLLAEDHYVEGLVDVMLDAVRNHAAPLSAERLFGWHCALFPTGRSGPVRITVGGWRTGAEPMQVVSGPMGHDRVHYQAPPSDAVAAEMQRFIDWGNTAGHSPFIMAAIAHLWVVSIHPFDDGNGRMSRTLSDLFLARLDSNNTRCYSMSAEINRNKKSYYDILERTQKGATLDITPWLQWFFNCLENAIIRASAAIERTMQKAAYWELFRNTPVNERQRKVVNRLWDGFDGNLTSSKWAKICRCSQDTALRDINDLIAKGMLRPAPAAGRSAHYLLP